MTPLLQEPPAQDAPSFTGLLPYHSVDPEGPIVLLADRASGAPEWLGMIFRLSIADTEVHSHDTLGLLAQRLEHLLEAIPEGSICQFLLRSRRNVQEELDRWTETSKTDDPILRKLASSRAHTLSALTLPVERTIYSARRIEVFFTIMRKGSWLSCEVSPLEALRAIVPGSDDVAQRVKDRVVGAYLRDRKELLDLAATLEALFGQARITPESLGEEDFSKVLYEYLNPRRAKTLTPWPAEPGALLRNRVADSNLSYDLDQGLVAIDGVWGKVVSVVGLPPATFAGELSRPTKDPREPSLVDLVPELDLALQIHVGDQDELRRRQAARRRLATNQSQNVHQSPALNPMREELVDLEQELARAARILSLRIHAVARADSPEAAGDYARALATRFANLGLRAIVEDALAPSLFLQSLPFAYRPDNDRALRRGRTLLAANAAHLIPVYGAFRGTPRATQMLLNRQGETVPLSFFNGCEVPHAVITGKSGSGKSVFANDLILNALRTGGRVFVLDRGGSYKKLAEMVSGTYLSYDQEPRRINPCGRSPADGRCPENIQSFLREWLSEMCTQGTSELSVPQQNLLTNAVRRAYLRCAGEGITISQIHAALLELGGEFPTAKDLALSILDFTAEGAYGSLFDGPGQVDFENPFVAIDLGNLVKKKAVGSVLLMALIQEVTEISLRWPHEDKYLLIDEGSSLLASPATARFLEDEARTARKRRLSLVMLSQQLTDFRGDSGRAILDQASTKVFLHHDAEAIRATADLTGLSDREIELYQSLRTLGGKYSEAFVRTPFGSGVVRLVMDPLSYWLTTTEPRDKELLERLREKHARPGASDRDALERALLDASMRYPQGAPAREVPLAHVPLAESGGK